MAEKKGLEKPDKKKPNHKSPWKRQRLTIGQWLADKIAQKAGSWSFIILFLVFLVVWMWINLFIHQTYGKDATFDPFPFILLNLILSCLAAIQAPVILMAQNRAAQRDRARATKDYYINRKAEKEIKMIQIQIIELKGIISKQSTEKEAEKLESEIKAIQAELENVSKTLQFE